MLRLALIALACLATLVSPAIVRADALADFERAESAYREQRYGVASTILEGVIASAASDPVEQAVVLESRKYLAACYLFLDRGADAERQFQLILEQDADYSVDPASFPGEVVARFDAVQRRFQATLAAERAAALAEAEARIAALHAEIAEERARYVELHELAASSLVLRRNSRVVALLPFGIGQFQNGNRRLGTFFAITEAALLGVYVGSFAWHTAIRSERLAENTPEELRWQRSVRAAFVLNWTSGGALLGLAVAGAVEAETRFVPTRETSTVRSVPARLRPSEGPVTQLRVLPTGLLLRVDF